MSVRSARGGAATPVVERHVVAHHQLQAQALGAGLADGNGLRVAELGHEELDLLAARDGTAHGHRLSCGRSLVQER